MEITAEYLQKEMESLRTQQAQALAVAQQAEGAVALIASLLERLKQPGDALTLGELASALGAQSAEIVEANDGSKS